jgi:UDP-glucuronate decarboxylase
MMKSVLVTGGTGSGFLSLAATGGAFTGPVNLGNPREFTVRQSAEKILAITGSR